MFGAVRHENGGAPVKRRLMVIGDSFVRPLQAMLSTVFSDILVLDQRRFAEGESVVKFVEDFKPDVVMQMNNPSALGLSRDFADGRATTYPPLFDYGELR